jgi:Cu/Ag efflux pump CusA
MAVVILGGIITSTFLNMIVIAALYSKYGGAVVPVERREFASEGSEVASVGD